MTLESSLNQSISEISEVKVFYPEIQVQTLKNYMKYSVTFHKNQKRQQMFRRYSDFKALRKNLRSYLPFHYIHPLPTAKIISNSDTIQLQDRVEELNSFLQFVVNHDTLKNCESVQKFFDENFQDTKIGEILSKIQNTYLNVDHLFQSLYPEIHSNHYEQEMELPILKFRERIDLSVNFCTSFHQSIKSYSDAYEASPQAYQYKTFLNLLSIHYSCPNNPEIHKNIVDSYEDLCIIDKLKEWKTLERKSKMIIFVINCLMEIYKDFERVVKAMRDEENYLKTLKIEKSKLEQSSSDMVGFFKKVSKEDKLNEIDRKIKASEDKIDLQRRLIVVGSSIILKDQLDMIKNQKQQRFKKIMDKFAKQQLIHKEKEINLWNLILQSNSKLFEIQDNELEKNIEDIHRDKGHEGTGEVSDIDEQ